MLAKLLQVYPTVTPWTVACQAPLSMDFLGKNTGVVAKPSSRGSSRPRGWTPVSFVSCIARGFFTTSSTWEDQFLPKPTHFYFGHLMRRVDSLENTLMLGGIGGRREGDDRG